MKRLHAILVFVALAGPAHAIGAEQETLLVSRSGSVPVGSPGFNQPPNASSDKVTLSADGRYVAFQSDADNLSPDDDNTVRNVFVRDLQTNTNVLVSAGPTSGFGAGPANDDSFDPVISRNGRYVAFVSEATNLSTEDEDGATHNRITDVFVRDLQTGTTTLASKASVGVIGGGAAANDSSRAGSVSDDGRYVAFESDATNLGPDWHSHSDVFLRDMHQETTTLVSSNPYSSQPFGPPVGPANAASTEPVISADGGEVAFVSAATNMPGNDDKSVDDIYVYRRCCNQVDLVTGNAFDHLHTDSSDPSISADGFDVAFESGGQVYASRFGLRQRIASRVSVSAGSSNGNQPSFDPAISADGRHVAFASGSTNLTTSGGAATVDIFVHDRTSETTALISRRSASEGGAAADGNSYSPAVSADGRYVAFASDADNLSTQDNNAYRNIFRRERDRTAPSTSVVTGPGARTADSTPTFSFSSPDPTATFTCQVDAQAFGPCSGPSSQHTNPTPLSDGSHTFRVEAIDEEGNRDPIGATRSFIVDTTPPNTSITSGPIGPVADERPTFGFSSTETGSTFECRFDTQPFASCSGPGDSHRSPSALGQGQHTFEVRATDSVSNTDPTPAIRSFFVDTQGPDTAIDSGPSGTTTNAQPEFTFSASEPGASFQCRFDSDPFGACSGPGATHRPASALGTGTHVFEVRAVDGLGNPDFSPASRSFTVVPTDTTPPDTTIDTGPQGLTSDSTPTYTFSTNEPGSSFSCRFDQDPFAPCSGPGASHTPTSPLGDGPHTFEVRATDGSGNTDSTPASRQFTVDTQAPSTTIDSGPTGATGDSTPTYTFSANESGSSFTCRFDSMPFAACSGPGASHTPSSPLGDGPHTFEVKATDQAGNTDQASPIRSFVVDTAAPQTTIDSGPTGPTNDATPQFSFSSSEQNSTYECRFDSDPFSACSGPGASHVPGSPLGEGAHTFEVRAVDAVGNSDPEPASRAFEVDTTAPVVTFEKQPPSKVFTRKKKAKVTFKFEASEAGVGFECSVDNGSFTSCTSPVRYSAKLGKRQFAVQATDPAGNIGERAVVKFRVKKRR